MSNEDNSSIDPVKLHSARFLFFLYYYPPIQGTAAKRNYLIASEIIRRVSFARIFTATKLEKGSTSPDENVETIKASDYRSLLRKKTKDGALPETSKESKWMQFVIRLINTFPINVLAGEGGLFYFVRLLRKGQRSIKEDKITHLYSSYRPFADHYAAYILKKWNPHLFWVADFRDLIIDPHYNHIYFPIVQQAFYKRVFKKAALLTTVSNGLSRHLKQYNSNVITLRNGIRNIPSEIISAHCKYFKLAYTGSMFLDKRNATPIFVAVTELINEGKLIGNDLRIIYAGKDDSSWTELATRYDLLPILDTRGIVSGAEANLIQLNACINLLLTVASDQLDGVLTGKMIEYFESGSPVLAIVVNQNDPELKSILGELEIGQSFSDRKEDLPLIKEFIYDEYLHWKRTGTNRKPVNMEVLKEKYSVEATMRPLFEKII